MNDSPKIRSEHLDRDAYLYVRQSSMRQVVENTESTKRQYALRGRALSLGWPADRIVVIDSDQGESGASAAWREGFQQLVTEVGMGRAGIVMGLEVSRLARNSADWHRLLEICALADTLILDEDGVYDPSCYNDRMLLGLKGTMSEAELHVLKARLRGGILNKARRGEYRCALPTGLAYNEAGEVVLDPDSQVRETIAYFFDTFSRVGSAHQTVKVFGREQLRFPSRRYCNGDVEVVFLPLTASTAMRTLRNPRYAGAYSYGRRTFRKTVNGTHVDSKSDCADWLACIPGAHPGYITWEQYEQNVRILESNAQGYNGAHLCPPREGPALLQGRAVCGKCGRHLRVRYATRRGRTEPMYVCDRGHGTRGEPDCQSISGPPVDEAVGRLVAQTMTREAVDLALQVRREIEVRHREADQLRLRAVEKARIEAELAERRFMMVDPANRLVADTLEADWNSKLRTLAGAQEERVQRRQDDLLAMDDTIRERLAVMTEDFGTLWSDGDTPSRERKRLLAHIVEDVTLVKQPESGSTAVHVRFRGGKTETLTAPTARSHADRVRTASETVALIDNLLNDFPCAEIAEKLNDRGILPGGSQVPGHEGQPFCAKRVAYIVHAYGLKSRHERLRDRGMLTKKELAGRLGVHEQTLARWAEHGIVRRHACNAHAFLYEDPGPSAPAKHCSRWDRLVDRPHVGDDRGAGSQGSCLQPEEVQYEHR